MWGWVAGSAMFSGLSNPRAVHGTEGDGPNSTAPLTDTHSRPLLGCTRLNTSRFIWGRGHTFAGPGMFDVLGGDAGFASTECYEQATSRRSCSFSSQRRPWIRVRAGDRRAFANGGNTPPCSNCIRTHSIISIWPIRWPNGKMRDKTATTVCAVSIHPFSFIRASSPGYERPRSSGQARTPHDTVSAGGARQLKKIIKSKINQKSSSYV